MAQFKKNDNIIVQNLVDGKKVTRTVGGYDFTVRFNDMDVRMSVYKLDNGAWHVIDTATGLSVREGSTRAKAVDGFVTGTLRKYAGFYMSEKHKEQIADFETVKGEDAPAEEVTEEVIEDAPADEAPAEVAEPVEVTEHNIWFAEKVDGASEYKGKRKKHAGMFWIPNTPANRKRFGIEYEYINAA